MHNRKTGSSFFISGFFLPLLFLVASNNIIAAEAITSLTVREVAKDLACPCQCPLILQDCNMSCGLRWKEEVGKKIAEGMNKQEITKYFIAKYGEDARLTPLQKIEGKIFQFTRGFGTMEWIILGSGAVIWMGFLFLIVYFFVRHFLRRAKAT